MKEAEHRQPCEQPFKIIDLFAGIGGFSLAGHWRGWETAAFVEKEPYCQKVLAKNFSGVPIIDDIRNYKSQKNAADIICGGFPCQPFSSAGKRGGKEDDRYLWPEMLRVIREVQPTYVLGENVAGLLSMDGGVVFEEICLSLEAEGYAVQSFVIPAISKGAPHRRDRVWIVGYSEHNGRNAAEKQRGVGKAKGKGGLCQSQRSNTAHGDVQYIANPKETECKQSGATRSRWAGFTNSSINTSNADFIRPQRSGQLGGQLHTEKNRKEKVNRIKHENQFKTNWYEAATRLCRVDDGLPSWVDGHRTARLKALGNAIVPQVAYEIFTAINNSTK